MGRGRLEAFSDGVIAIIITIMVLELKVPHEVGLQELFSLWPVFLSYILSFINVGIYWNNHHHLMHTVVKVDAGVMWANMHLLFWLSLFPFCTAYMGENHFSVLPTLIYGIVLLCGALSYFLLQLAINASGHNVRLSHAIRVDFKGKFSLGMYIIALPLAFVHPYLADICYVVVAGMWLMPDRRIERAVNIQYESG